MIIRGSRTKRKTRLTESDLLLDGVSQTIVANLDDRYAFYTGADSTNEFSFSLFIDPKALMGINGILSLYVASAIHFQFKAYSSVNSYSVNCNPNNRTIVGGSDTRFSSRLGGTTNQKIHLLDQLAL